MSATNEATPTRRLRKAEATTRPRLGSTLRRGVQRTVAAVARALLSGLRVIAPFFALVRVFFRPALSLVSAAGWLVIAVALTSLISGFALGWQELTVLAFALIASLAACGAYLIGRSTYAVDIELNPSRVVVGERAMGQLTVRNDGPKALLPAVMELPVGGAVAEFGIPGLKPGEVHDELFAVPTERRAVIEAGPARSVRGDHLGLLRRVVDWTGPVDLYVHPRTTPLAPSAAGLVRDLEGQVTSKITNNDLAFHALRQYVPGDDRRYVHWRTSARTGQLMVRQFNETRRSQLTMVLSENSASYSDAEEFELAVGVTASIATQVIRDGTQISVVAESRTLRTHAPTALLDDSCRVALQPSRFPSPRDFVRSVTRRLPPPSVLIVVAGSAWTPSDFRGIQLLMPSDTTMLGVVVSRGATPAIARVSGVSILTIGVLSDLPKVIRRVQS
jgi:hypothetical protein